jgi:hypothetical protein
MTITRRCNSVKARFEKEKNSRPCFWTPRFARVWVGRDDRKLRGIDPHVTAIIGSGYSDEAALSEFLAHGLRAALPKPFTGSELAEALTESFRDRESELARLSTVAGCQRRGQNCLRYRLAFGKRFQLREKRTRAAVHVTELSDFFPLAV